MKSLILSGVVAMLLVGGVWGVQQRSSADSIKCPVMPSRSVNIADATRTNMYGDHKGRRYYLCCAPCVSAFAKNPEAFAKGPSLPIPKK